MHIEVEQDGLALQTREADVGVAGQTMLKAAVQTGLGDVLQDAVDDVVTQLLLVGHALFQMLGRHLEGLAHASDASDVLSTSAVACFLAAAVDEVLGPDALAAVQSAHALGAVELVSAHGQHIHAQLLDIHGDGTHSLNRIGVHPDAVLVGDLSDLLDGLDGADLVVGHHDADEGGVGADSSLDILRTDVALRGGLDISDLETQTLESCHAVHDGVVLESAGDEVLLVLAGLGEGSTLHSPVVGLRAAAGEEDLGRGGVDGLCHLCAALVHELLGLIAHTIMAAGVAAGAVQCLDHHSQCFGSAGSGSSVIQINHFFCVFHRNGSFLLKYGSTAPSRGPGRCPHIFHLTE